MLASCPCPVHLLALDMTSWPECYPHRPWNAIVGLPWGRYTDWQRSHNYSPLDWSPDHNFGQKFPRFVDKIGAPGPQPPCCWRSWHHRRRPTLDLPLLSPQSCPFVTSSLWKKERKKERTFDDLNVPVVFPTALGILSGRMVPFPPTTSRPLSRQTTELDPERLFGIILVWRTLSTSRRSAVATCSCRRATGPLDRDGTSRGAEPSIRLSDCLEEADLTVFKLACSLAFLGPQWCQHLMPNLLAWCLSTGPFCKRARCNQQLALWLNPFRDGCATVLLWLAAATLHHRGSASFFTFVSLLAWFSFAFTSCSWSSLRLATRFFDYCGALQGRSQTSPRKVEAMKSKSSGTAQFCSGGAPKQIAASPPSTKPWRSSSRSLKTTKQL